MGQRFPWRYRASHVWRFLLGQPAHFAVARHKKAPAFQPGLVKSQLLMAGSPWA